MSFSHLWPSFPAARILYEDQAIIVIDKPVDVPTHGADAARHDDALTRLRLALAERDRLPVERVYLGTHQRLDRDTSGTLLFTRQKEANASMGAQFEARTVKKSYLAVVSTWPARRAEGVLTHDIEAGEDGRMQVVGQGGRKSGSKGNVRGRTPAHGDARRAITRYRVIERDGSRALLELHPETGRTHQLRVQLAAVGGPIAGDRLYGGEAAPRLMLHAVRLELKHPTTGKPVDIRAPVPVELESWLTDPRPAVGPADDRFDGRLMAAVNRRFSLGRAADTDAFRLAHGEGDGLEGLALDVYGDYIVVHFFSDAALAQRDVVLDKVFALGARGVYVKVHPKQANTLVDPRQPELAPADPVRGEAAPAPLWIREQGLSFRVLLGDGLKTGIFLDQRANRRRIRELSRGKSVLNLFAYTCGFSVAAAAGGARETVSVDTSEGVLAWGAENLARNGFGSAGHAFVGADVFAWLKVAGKRPERYDLVVLDPPSYATTKTSRFSAESDWPDLASRAMSVMAEGGRMLVCTNHRGISKARFRRLLHEAGRLSRRRLVQMKDLPEPEDFPSPPGAVPHLKSVLLTVE